MTAENGNADRPPRMRLWVRLLLLASLALNLLFVGLVGGALMRQSGPPGRAMPQSVSSALFRALPEPERKAMRDTIREMRRSDGGRAKAMEDARLIAEVLRRQPFDRAALEAEIAAHIGGELARVAAVRAAWLDQIEALGDQGRDAAADRMLKHLENGKRWKGGRPSQ